MGIFATETYNYGEGENTAERSFFVGGTTNIALARLAPGVPRRGQRHPRIRGLVCLDVFVRNPANSPDTFLVTAPYGTPDQLTGTVPSNPLADSPMILPEPFTLQVNSQTDLDGRLVQNSAGDLIDGGIPLDVQGVRFYYRIAFRRFDINRASRYINAVNETPISLFGTTWPAEHLLVEHIGTPNYYRADGRDEYVYVVHQFAGIYPDSPLGKYPWQYGVLNVGRNGWCNIDGKVSKAALTTRETKIKAAETDPDEVEYQPVNWDVPLGMDGLPITTERQIFVGGGGKQLFASPVKPQYYKALAISQDRAGGSDQTSVNEPNRIYFRRRKVLELRSMFNG